MKQIYFVILIIIFVSCTPQPQSEQTRWVTHAANIEIIRDDFGVPHIYGKTDAAKQLNQ